MAPPLPLPGLGLLSVNSRHVVMPIYGGETGERLICRATIQEVRQAHGQLGFLRVGWRPALVLDGVRLEFERAGDLAAALAAPVKAPRTETNGRPAASGFTSLLRSLTSASAKSPAPPVLEIQHFHLSVLNGVTLNCGQLYLRSRDRVEFRNLAVRLPDRTLQHGGPGHLELADAEGGPPRVCFGAQSIPLDELLGLRAEPGATLSEEP